MNYNSKANLGLYRQRIADYRGRMNQILLYIQSTRYYKGESADAVSHYHKLCSRVPLIRGNRRRQPCLSAMTGPQPGGTALLITVSPEPGKYEEKCFGYSPNLWKTFETPSFD